MLRFEPLSDIDAKAHYWICEKSLSSNIIDAMIVAFLTVVETFSFVLFMG